MYKHLFLIRGVKLLNAMMLRDLASNRIAIRCKLGEVYLNLS